MIWNARANSYPLSELAKSINVEILGIKDTEILGVCALDEQIEGCITFLSSKSKKVLRQTATTCRAAALIVRKEAVEEGVNYEVPLLPVEDPLPTMVRLIASFYEAHSPTSEISDKADIHPGATIGRNVSIGAFCSVGEGAVIEEGSILYPHVTIYPRAHIGPKCILHSGVTIREFCTIKGESVIQNGAIIGADGFGYFPSPEGLKPVPQVGTAVIERKVDIGANTCIDRGALGTTKIGLGVKIDNLVQIGHNVEVGQHTVICGDVAIGGSTKIGNQAVLGGATSFADHLTIKDGARFSGRAAAGHFQVYEKGDYAGYPAIPIQEFKKLQVLMRRLPEFSKRLRKLEKKCID